MAIREYLFEVISDETELPVYPMIAPQSVSTPYCVYQVLESDATYSKTRYEGQDVVDVVVKCVGATYTEANLTATLMSNYFKSSVIDGADPAINRLVVTSGPTDDYDKDAKLHVSIIELKIVYKS